MELLLSLWLIVPLAPLSASGVNSFGNVQGQPDGQLPVHWFMGTATGDDRVLEIQTGSKLRFRQGGCGHFLPWIESAYSVSGGRILIHNPKLQAQFGPSLIMARYKSNLILVPEKAKGIIKSKNFSPTECFWVNLLGADGLELSKDTKDFVW